MKYIHSKKEVVKITIEGEHDFNLDYSIIQNSDKIYGIEINKKILGSNYSERAVVMLSERKDEVLELINKLARCEVTPLTLDYIIEDLFGRVPITRCQ